MLTIWNRAELLLTQSQERFCRVEIALQEAGIDYSVKFRDLNGHAYDRARLGSLGRRPGVEYVIYVNRSSLDWARHILAQAQY